MLNPSLEKQLRASVEALGYDLIGIECQGVERLVLRLYIDNTSGVTLDDCSSVSDQISGLLDVEGRFHTKYLLEVSSPGLNRPLFRKQDFDRFCGSTVRVVMQVPIHGRLKYVGKLINRDNDVIHVLMDDTQYQLPLCDIRSARLKPEF